MLCVRTGLALVLFVCLLGTTAARGADLPQTGDVLPAMVFQNTLSAAERAALGVGDGPTFALSDVRASLILFEFFGVYCSVCHEQAPDFNRLVKSLGRDGATKNAVRVLSLAAGATDMELEYARKSMKAAYPMLNDLDYTLHKLLGEPKTPFALLVRPDGTVLWAHLGHIGKPGDVLNLIKSHL